MFVPLHVKSDYSFGYGTASVDELVERAAALGFTVLALTDLENLCGQVHFHHQCRIHGIRPITGVEFRPGFDGRRHLGSRLGRVVLLAADHTGYRNLCRIVSRRRGAAGPRGGEGTLGQDPLPLVASQAEGLFALSDDPSVLEQLLARGSFPLERLGFLTIRPQEASGEGPRRDEARRLGVRLVADVDVVFLREDDYPLHVLQVAVRQGRLIGEMPGSVYVESKQRWLRSPEEANRVFADIPEAIDAAAAIAEACRLDLSGSVKAFPDPDFPTKIFPEQRLRRMCEEALAVRRPELGAWTESHRRRLEEELSTFERLGLSRYLLVVAEIIGYCRDQCIPVVARGSGVSSLTLHVLGASPIDPMAHGLLFERFLHAGKSAWPDVDLDLPWHRRDEVIEWVYQRFGRKRVAMVGAHHSFQRRSALREGLKAWGARQALIESLIRALPPEDLGLEEVDFLELSEHFEEGQTIGIDGIEPSARPISGEVLALIQRLIGQPHRLAAHPGGIVVGERPLEDLVPLERAAKGVVITQYDLTAVAELGLVKIDLLGNRCLSEIEETLRLSGSVKFPLLDTIPCEDPSTIDFIDRAETVGCFQLESPAMRSLLARLPIRHQSDLVAALALIRPGAASGEAKATFVRRARGEVPDEPFDAVIADRLSETHGMLLYEEDIMMLLSRLGGLSLGEADELRSAIVRSGGNPEVLAALESNFLERARVILGTEEAGLLRARRAWTAAARFAAYSFNKAHAVSYGQLAYFSAYMKVHHPLEFACALINHYQGFYPLRTVAGELARMGLKLRPPHINTSAYQSTLEKDSGETTWGAVRVGLDKVNVLSRRVAQSLLEERADHGTFTSLLDLLERVRLPGRELAALVLSGACDNLPPLTEEAYPFIHEAALERLRQGRPPAELDALRLEEPPGARAKDGRKGLYQALVRVRNELRYLGMHLSFHPMALLRAEASRHGCLSIRTAAATDAGSELRLAAIIAAMRRVATRQGPMQFLTLEDETGLLEAALLPPAYRRIGEKVITPGPFLVEGRMQRQQGALHLEVSRLAPFKDRHRPFDGGFR